MRRILSSDPITKTRKVFRYHHEASGSDSITIETEQDVTPVVEITKAEFNALDERTPWKNDMNHVARIPTTLMGELMASGVWYDDQALLKWMDDANNRAWRVRPGKVSK